MSAGSSTPEIHGDAADGFGPVADAFLANFTDHGDVGAACAVYRDGVPVVDLWAGIADPATAKPWEVDTVVPVFSSTKGVTAAVAHMLVDRGLLDVDAPVARYWPEFAAAGKERLPVRYLLSHQAGLPMAAEDRQFTPQEIVDWFPLAEALAAQAPYWEPGTAHGYHNLSYGTLVGEVVRRITGLTPGTYLAKEIAAPLHLDLYVGLPQTFDRARLATTFGVGLQANPPARTSFVGKVMTMTWPLIEWNDPAIQSAELPAGNGICDARSLARMYAACVGEVDGVRLMDPGTLAAATTTQSDGIDWVMGLHSRYGVGWSLPTDDWPLLGPSSFGHAGAGGSLGCGDIDAGVGFAYVMNHRQAKRDPRAAGLLDAVRRCLA